MEENTYTTVNALLDEGKATGMVKNIDNKLLIGFVTGGIAGYVTYMQNTQEPLTQELIDTAFDLCLDTIQV